MCECEKIIELTRAGKKNQYHKIPRDEFIIICQNCAMKFELSAILKGSPDAYEVYHYRTTSQCMCNYCPYCGKSPAREVDNAPD